MKHKIGVVGANGYTGLELLKLLGGHPHVSDIVAVSRSEAGKKITDLFPQLSAYTKFGQGDGGGAVATPPSPVTFAADIDAVKNCDAAFLCLPHAAASETAAALNSAGVKVIDLSADFRYKSLALYESVYGVKHAAPALLKKSVYGLTELFRKDIKKADIVGNPGCYTTCAILSLYPLLKEGLISTGGIIIDAKSGASGAGKKADLAFSFCELDENFKAYSVTGHRHTSEIEENLSLAAGKGKNITVSFTPHLLPVKRGILETIYCRYEKGVKAKDIAAAYGKYYAGEQFVKILGENSFPELKFAANTNMFMTGFTFDERTSRLIIISALDNLLKGAAGQAVQNMNVMFGLSEECGLT